MFERLTDNEVLDMLRKQAEACERVMAMPEAQRTAPTAKGGASPEQAGALNAMLAIRAEAEAARRGLLTAVLQ